MRKKPTANKTAALQEVVTVDKTERKHFCFKSAGPVGDAADWSSGVARHGTAESGSTGTPSEHGGDGWSWRDTRRSRGRGGKTVKCDGKTVKS